MNMNRRSTADTVVLMLAAIVGVSLGSLIIGSFIVAIVNPETDLGAIVRYLTDLTSTIVGALIGFIGGRASAKKDE